MFINPLTKEWYMSYETGEWDVLDGGYVHEKIYINYCPWCGRELAKGKGKRDKRRSAQDEV